jgi:hypothetical protein
VGSSPDWVKPKTKKIFCFSAKQAALRRKIKDWLAQNQNKHANHYTTDAVKYSLILNVIDYN